MNDTDPQTGTTDALLDLAQTLVDALEVQAGLILLWHTEEGQLSRPAGAGLPPDDLAQLETLLTTAAPDLLQTLAGARPHAARVGVLPGWRLDLARHQAEVTTPWGPLQVRAVPVDGAVALLAVLPTVAGSGWAERPHAWRVLVRYLELAVQTGQCAARLGEQARLLDTVLAQSSDGLLVLDAAGHIIRCNAAAERMTGWHETDLQGRPFTAALQVQPMHWAADEAGATATPPDLLQPGGEGRALELVLTTRAGQSFYSEATVTPLDSSDPIGGVLVSLRDVSASREAEELQATFLSVISHELQTPLAIIRGYAELLADGVATLPPDRLRSKLAVIAEESERLSKMVASLLDASRIGAGGLELVREPVDIPRLVRRAVQKMEAISPQHPFVVALPADLPPVLADYARVEQVLINLLENAVKYSPKGGQILVTSDLLSEAVIVHVSDQGIGVPSAERERIFARFARLDSRVVRRLKGVGLGLFIARAIIQAHGGRIWVDTAPAGGAQFSFSLPRQFNAPLPIVFGRS